MIFCFRQFAFFLGMLGAFGQLLGAFAGFRLGAIARGGLLPIVDLLLRGGPGGIVALAWVSGLLTLAGVAFTAFGIFAPHLLHLP